MENDNRDNAFIKFKWPEPEDHSSISEDMAIEWKCFYCEFKISRGK